MLWSTTWSWSMLGAYMVTSAPALLRAAAIHGYINVVYHLHCHDCVMSSLLLSCHHYCHLFTLHYCHVNMSLLLSIVMDLRTCLHIGVLSYVIIVVIILTQCSSSLMNLSPIKDSTARQDHSNLRHGNIKSQLRQDRVCNATTTFELSMEEVEREASL